jgi:ABC-type phosphate transport system auxiliary subunit
MKRALISLVALLIVPAAALSQDTVRYALEKTADGYVRMDKSTGEMSICKEASGQLVCRLAADERAAYDGTLTDLAKRVEVLEQKLAALEGAAPKQQNVLPSEQEFDKTLSMMERFMRRFMGVVRELEDDPSLPQKT